MKFSHYNKVLKVLFVWLFLSIVTLANNELADDKYNSKSNAIIRDLYHLAADYKGPVPYSKKKKVLSYLTAIDTKVKASSLNKKLYIERCIQDLKSDLVKNQDFNIDDSYLDDSWETPPRNKKRYFRVYSETLQVLSVLKLAGLYSEVKDSKTRSYLFDEIDRLENEGVKILKDPINISDFNNYVQDLREDLKHNREFNVDSTWLDEEFRRKFIRWGWAK